MGPLSALMRAPPPPPSPHPLTTCTHLGLKSKGILCMCVARSLYPQMELLSALKRGSTSTQPPPTDPLYPLGTHLKGNIGRVCSEGPISADGAAVCSDGRIHLHQPLTPCTHLGLTSKGIFGVCVARSLYPQISADGAVVRSDGGLHLHPPTPPAPGPTWDSPQREWACV